MTSFIVVLLVFLYLQRENVVVAKQKRQDRQKEWKLSEDSSHGPSGNRTLLYTVVGECDQRYRAMLCIMMQSALRHLGQHVQTAVIALNSCGVYSSTDLAFVNHLILLNPKQFAPAQAPIPSQASANKLRIFKFFPAVHSYDIVVYLDADIFVRANFLALLGPLMPNTLYVKDEVRSRAHPLGPPDAFFSRRGPPSTFNCGQFVFRPSQRFQQLFQHSYETYLKRPTTVTYEQGPFNAVLCSQGKLSYTLTHLVALHAQTLSPEAAEAFAVLHFCGTPSDVKLLHMLRWNASTHATRSDNLHLLVPTLRQWVNSTDATWQVPWLTSWTLVTVYVDILQASANPRVCILELGNVLAAVIALFSNPTASVTLLSVGTIGIDPAHVVGRLQREDCSRRHFPDPHRVQHLSGLPTNATALVHVLQRGVGCAVIVVACNHTHAAVRHWLQDWASSDPQGFVLTDCPLGEAEMEAFHMVICADESPRWCLWQHHTLI
eukprot:GGOE01003927.1.p1 GENE.GGOE01003927.1~~GGOE01003927.1.p1  ORF type:complete len:491 (+),score=74.09 GGOE01003927.1:45-1517(+)